MSLSEIRKQIDAIDAQLLPLFVQRMQCAEQVAESKKASNMPIFNPGRESEILAKVAKEAGEYDIEAMMLYHIMMSLSRMRQHKILHSGDATRAAIEAALNNAMPLEVLSAQSLVGCVGEGSYANQAALQLFPGREMRYLASHDDIFRLLEEDQLDIGIVPVENSSAGSVAEVYDLIMQYRFSILAASTVQVRHCLAAPQGATLDTIQTVTSHPQALSQCSNAIHALRLRPMQYANTATAAKMIADTQDVTMAVICSPLAAQRYGLTILQTDLQNNPHNRTRFLAIQKQMAIPTDANKISLCFSLHHKTGTLYSVLGRFAMHGLNLTKIESRPSKASPDEFQYDFYLDFTGSIKEEKTLELICELSSELENFSFLGNYLER